MNREKADEIKRKFEELKKNKTHQKEHANRPHYGVKTLIGNWDEQTRPFHFVPTNVEPVTRTDYRSGGGEGRTRMNTARVNKDKMITGATNLFIVGDRRPKEAKTPSNRSDHEKHAKFKDTRDATTMTSSERVVPLLGHKRYGIRNMNSVSSIFP